MRIAVLIISLVIAAGCNSPKKISAKPRGTDGVWIPVSQELGGTALPASTYKNYTLVLADSVYTYGGAQTDQGVIVYKAGRMDIYGRQGVNAGKHFTAIYKLENGLLTVCYNLAGTGYPEGFQTTGQRTYFLSVFKKQ